MDVELRTLRDAEWPAFFDLMEAAFDEREIFERYAEHDPLLGADETWVADCDGRLVAACQIFPKRIRLRGREIALGGIGSVGTHPEFERRGLATRVLECALADMRRRGMALSMLFTGRLTFYARLDYVSIPNALWVVHPREPRPERDDRDFEVADLPALRALYDRYCAALDGTTLRDERYWRAQLRCAGDRAGDFRVVGESARPLAWARALRERMTVIMEHGREPGPGSADALARTILGLAPPRQPILVHDCGDEALAEALRAHATRMDPIRPPDMMWRVLDRPALEALLPEDERGADDAVLLERLVGPGRGIYWSSDRF